MRSTAVLTLALSVLATSGVTTQETTFRYTEGTILGTREDRSASVVFADVDGDGDLDIVVASGRHWPAQNEIFLNNGRGRFMVARPLGEERATSYETPLGDLDGDGDLDVVTGNDVARNLVLLNSGTGHFRATGTVGDLARPTRGITLA
ncbi:MAG: VCBS repeat-containing protein, partial [Gemmatimonadetes bacterium]|nr:VCBS repeat-containing protein [Gemmatimonadota bacterium]